MSPAPDSRRWLPILDGERTDLTARLTRIGLVSVTPFYRAAVALRNWRYDRGWGTSRLDVPVISIGNLTTGGTGKTPFVIWMVNHLLSRAGKWSNGPAPPPHQPVAPPSRVVLLSRGYGATAGQPNDEAEELAERLPNIPHLQGPDRVTLARRALAQYGPEAIVLDDGFQHRRLARDLDIVLVDASQPFGLGYLLPRGLLREPVSAIRRADAIVLTRTEQVGRDECRRIRARLQSLHPDAVWAETTTCPTGLFAWQQPLQSMEMFCHQPVFAFGAIGNPRAFQRTLIQAGFELRGFRPFPDHHQFTAMELNEIARQASALGAAGILCTHKDLVKIRRTHLDGVPIRALQIDLRIESGKADLVELIDRRLSRFARFPK